MDVKVGQQVNEDIGNIDLANNDLNSEKYFSLPSVQRYLEDKVSLCVSTKMIFTYSSFEFKCIL